MVTVYVAAVAPVIAVPFFFHKYVKPVPAFAVNTTEPPEQNVVAPPAVIVAVGKAFTTIASVVELAHCPAFGVNVYVVVAVLFNAGDHVPVTPLFEVVGNGLNVVPLQIGATAVNVGVTLGKIVTPIVAIVAHCPALGVKV